MAGEGPFDTGGSDERIPDAGEGAGELAGAPAAQPENPVAVAARGSRGLRAVSRLFRLDVLIPFMIAAVSLIGAAVTWQASDTAATAGGLDAQVLREATERQQILSQIRAVIVHDRLVFAEYQEHITAWHDLDTRAEAATATGPALARSLRFQAQAHLAQARTLRPMFRAQIPDFGDETGLVPYDDEAALTYLTDSDSRLTNLDPEATRTLAVARHDLAIQLVAVVIALVGSLFLLTVAQLGRGVMRVWFGVLGIIVAVLASGLFIGLEMGAG